MKIISHHFLFFFPLFFFALLINSCTTIQSPFAGVEDARIAFQKNEAFVNTYKFEDLMGLKVILDDLIKSYALGISYLRKQSQQKNSKEKTILERKLIGLERLIRIIDAHIDNLPLLYPDDWTKEKEDLDKLCDELYKDYREIYLILNPIS